MPVCRSVLVGAANRLFPPECPGTHYRELRCDPDKLERVQKAVLHILRRDPHQVGFQRSRWRLEDLGRACFWLPTSSRSAVWHVLDQLGISYKRGQHHVHSPDPAYLSKCRYIEELLERVRRSGGRLVLLYEDELTYYRQPTLARSYEKRGDRQPTAELSHQSNTPTRVAATLDPLAGKVLFYQNQRVGIEELLRLYRQVHEAYKDAEQIYIVQDCWPIHFHPELLAALEPQLNPWPVKLSPYWTARISTFAKRKTAERKTAERKAAERKLPIQLVPLPTYASWLNPVEKLWRWLKQDVLHQHRLAHLLSELRQEVERFLDRYSEGSTELLRYTGLLKPN